MCKKSRNLLAYPDGCAVGIGQHDAATGIDHEFGVECLLAVAVWIWHEHGRKSYGSGLEHCVRAAASQHQIGSGVCPLHLFHVPQRLVHSTGPLVDTSL